MKKSIKTILITGFVIVANLVCSAQGSTGVIKGQILNADREPVFGATIKITAAGVLIGGTTTDVEGNYTYKPINAGTYELMVMSSETQTKKINNVVVRPEKTSYVDVKVDVNTYGGEVIVEAEYEEPIVDKSFVNMQSMDATAILHSSNDRSDIKAMVEGMSSAIVIDAAGELHLHGGRGEATMYYIDGVRTENPGNFPMLSVDNLSVITGGIPAQYGDLTSGVIIINTKDYFSGIRHKRMAHKAISDNYELKQREKKAKEEEEKRKKEIEEELRLEQQNKG